MTTFRNPNDPNNLVITAKVTEWVRIKMNLSEDTLIKVLELDCADSGCVDKETRISLTFNDNTSQHLRIHKPLVFVRQHDIEHLLKNLP